MEHATRRAILNSPLYLMEFKHLGVIGLLKDVLVTRNIDLEYGQEPSRLLCSLVRLYMLHPDRSIVHEILSARGFAYTTAFAAIHVRCYWSSLDIHKALTPLLSNYTKIHVSGLKALGLQGHVPLDVFVETLLRQPSTLSKCNKTFAPMGCLRLPLLTKRELFELSGKLRPLSEELQEMLKEKAAENGSHAEANVVI
ncbi:Hypothetical protein GLP15_4793 [Giardia lamblia P15]|uniref:Pre-mRNA-splicing factor 38 n=1 Tax=Giardia intestinalis (strain P15) TaxID=658858 RepID=E1F9P4_GIAIA|nr:Hypothetical protein GLP15_4793 [Giardia lamblia P15]